MAPMKQQERYLDEVCSMITSHARVRMGQRGIRPWQVGAVLDHGRTIFARGARIMVVGRREVQRAMKNGLDIRGCNGIQLVMCPSTGGIMTAYRNQDLRGLRPRRRSAGRS